jgi:phosphatidate phosphatase LPIN
VEFKVNGVKQDYAMKLGEGGEAFFVFPTTDEIPESMQTSPLISPMASPKMRSEENLSTLQEPEYLDLDHSKGANHPPLVSRTARATSDLGTVACLSPLAFVY